MQRSILYMLLALVVAGFTLPTAAVSQATASELAGTSWQLVEISSMDDSTDVPDDPSRYTLELGADGSVSILADCNRGMGSWSSEGSSRLTFGPLATTRAMCPPQPRPPRTTPKPAMLRRRRAGRHESGFVAKKSVM